MKKSAVMFLVVLMLSSGLAHASHPLVSEDVETQGKGGVELEINGETSWNKETEEGITIRERESELSTSITAGFADNADFIIEFPWIWAREKVDGEVIDDMNGGSDVSLAVKWRFFEKDGLSLAVKPEVTLPTGNDTRGLGSGRPAYGATLIAGKETEEVFGYLNLRYSHHDFRIEEVREAIRADIWHASLAAGIRPAKYLEVVGNVGVETNPDKSSRTWPAFALAGLIYNVTEDLAVDLGGKWGLNDEEADFTALAGVTIGF